MVTKLTKSTSRIKSYFIKIWMSVYFIKIYTREWNA